MFNFIRAWLTKDLTMQLDQFRQQVHVFVTQSDEQHRMTRDGVAAQFSVVLRRLETDLPAKLDLIIAIQRGIQQFAQSQFETNHDILTTVRAVDARVEHYIQLLQGCPPDEDELPLEQKLDLGQLATQLYEIRNIVAEFKADLSTQVRLSQSDYDDVLKTSDARLSEFSKRIDTLQQDLADFRVEFRQATSG